MVELHVNVQLVAQNLFTYHVTHSMWISVHTQITGLHYKRNPVNLIYAERIEDNMY